MVMDEVKNQICNTKVAKSQALSPVKLHKVKGSGSCGQTDSAGEGEGESPSGTEGVWSINKAEESLGAQPTTSSLKELRISQSHSKKVVKHALRQQAKRRRKNTTIASGNTAPISRIVMPPHELEEVTSRVNYKPPTMMEVLSSIPGFSIKQRKRSNKKLSAAAQLEQTKEGCIDLETPDSILVNTNLRSLLNKHTFNSLPTLYQHKLVQLLPQVDRAPPASDSFRLSASGLNNEFFARACLEWRERLAEGEFTPEHQQKLKAEAEREKSKLDPWKLKHFEPIWGESATGSTSVVNLIDKTPPPPAPPKPKPAVKVKTPPAPAPPPRLRTVGAVTRAVANYREKREAEESNQLEPNKRVKSAVKPDVGEPSVVTSECSSTVIPVTSTTSQQCQTSPILEHVTSEVEEVKEEEKPAVEKMEEEVDESNETPLEEAKNKCTEEDVADKENLEVKKDEPVKEVEEQNEEQPEECNDTSESDNFKQVCDIRTNEEEIKSKEETVPSEETEDEKRKETEIAQNTQEYVNIQERPSGDEGLCQSVDNQNMLCLEREGNEDLNLDETESQVSHEEPDPKSVESNHQAHQETCDRSVNSDACNAESMEVEEEKTNSKVNESTDHNTLNVPITFQTNECENFRNSSQPELNFNTVEEENKANTLDETTLPSEVEMVNAQRFPEAVPEENLDDERYEVDINDSLEYVNEETSTSLQNCAEQVNSELTNNQDSIDSQGKEDSCNYSVKMEDDLDLQDTGSNLQSQDSQDTRNDEESCHQESDLMIPDSEGGDMSGAEYNMYSSVIYQEALKEDVETAALLAAWGAVGPSTEKLLAEVALQEEEEDTHVPVIPMQEDLDIRLEEIKSGPNGSEWQTYDKSSNLSEDSQNTKPASEQYGDHVKLELEVTLTPTPEVDSQVSSTMESGPTLPGTPNSNFSTSEEIVPSTSAAPVTVIPPTTFVCLPPSNPTCTVQTPMHLPPAQPGVVSSSAAVPYLALTTSTPVRAYPTKPKMSGVTTAGRSSRNVSTKPPPGAVNLERSYQICQAVIQNSPNRDQLRCQLKPPPSMLISTKDKTQYSVVTSSRGTKVLNKPRYQQRPTTPVVVKHVFTSSQGYPVTMAVLPQTQPTNNPEVAEGQTGHYVLVQRAGTQVRRSNSAPPSNNENMVGVGGRGRPASVGEGGTGGDNYPAKQNMRSADCPCSLKAMIACKKCGAFCHDDCIDPPSRVCVTCLIR